MKEGCRNVRDMIQESLDHGVCSLHREPHVIQKLTNRLVFYRWEFPQVFHAGQQGHQGVLHFVRHSGGQQPNGLQLLRLDELQLGGLESLMGRAQLRVGSLQLGLFGRQLRSRLPDFG